MSIHSIRRQVKNVALKYSEAQVKVRNATSNSPSGPSAYQMEEIAILTQNPVCYMEIMAIIWQRLNDSNKNWRHVDKSLTLLEYLIRRGHSQVIEMSRQNLYMIETLKDFEYEENRQDRGFDIRQKALNIASVLTDLETLKKKNRENSGMERNGQRMEMVREYPDELLPSDMIEEDMQLQLALALSREQCEKELEMSKSDEVRLQMAMENSKKSQPTIAHVDPPTLCSSSNLLGGLSDPWAVCSSATATATSSTDVLMMNTGFETNFLEIPKLEIPKLDDFWNPPAPPTLIEPPRSLNLIGDFMSTSPAKTPICTTSSSITNNFLGENGKLVNLDDLMGTGSASSSSGNPWSSSSHQISAPPAPVNSFASQRKMPTLNEMRAAQNPAHFTTNQSIDNRSIFENQQIDKSVDPFAGLFF
ncbi:hypothetical protein L3Y34_009730 [Caenorhabditis briggsae]|uniref:ENTH domain-containing protein n=2 Tax=Caenorhabditis briggsae TaxID=6238 RepID=A0AAE9ACT0_CAEBR|nr:hypothetical protein L3Y34_009730 [Caenorhabditis briggsae]